MRFLNGWQGLITEGWLEMHNISRKILFGGKNSEDREENTERDGHMQLQAQIKRYIKGVTCAEGL